MDTNQRHEKGERHQLILGEARTTSAVRIFELADRFGVSCETIRRDLDELGEAGSLRRIYGGATLPSPAEWHPGTSHGETKPGDPLPRMAAAAAQRITPGQTVMIGGGIPASLLGRLPACTVKEITIITNNIGIAAAGASASAQVILCPGTYNAQENCVHGEDTIEYIERFNADMAFFGSGALSINGASDVVPAAANVKRSMCRRSRKTILLVRADNLERTALQDICPLNAFSEIFTDRKPPRSIATACRAIGVKLTTA